MTAEKSELERLREKRANLKLDPDTNEFVDPQRVKELNELIQKAMKKNGRLDGV